MGVSYPPPVKGDPPPHTFPIKYSIRAIGSMIGSVLPCVSECVVASFFVVSYVDVLFSPPMQDDGQPSALAIPWTYSTGVFGSVLRG